MGRFLTSVAGYAHTPPLLGVIEDMTADGTPTALAAAFAFVGNQGNGWDVDLDHLDRVLEEVRHTPEANRPPAESLHDFYLIVAQQLGRRTAELHRALAINTADAAFAREPVTEADREAWLAAARTDVAAGFAALERQLAAPGEALTPTSKPCWH